MKGIQQFFKSPLFIAMATAAKFVQPIPIVFGLSRSTRCGCCSYQVSSISVNKKGGNIIILGFLSSNFMKHRRNEQKLMKLDRNNIHI
jgi:hypothetical protein